MGSAMTTFSERHGYAPSEPEVTVREDAPEEFRGVLVDMVYEVGWSPHDMRALVCRLLRRRENSGNWSAFPNVDCEVRGYLDQCEWNEVYDIAEAVHQALVVEAKRIFHTDEQTPTRAEQFAAELNRYFRRRGFGWQLHDGKIETRGTAAFESVLHDALDRLKASGRATAAGEMAAAVQDLSVRPKPDITGAIQHAMAALECVCRDVTGDSKATLGSVLAANRGLFPVPVDEAVIKLWGFASERGRHLREGRAPEFAEAALVVHVSAASIRYLVAKFETSA